MTVTKALKYFYKNMEEFVYDIYSSVFEHDYDSCFLSHYWLEKIVEKKLGSKEKKKTKMLHLASCLHRNPDMRLEESLDRDFNSSKARVNVMSAFAKISISPAVIQAPDIAYIPSINALIEFEEPDDINVKYFKYVQKKSRGKIVFLNRSEQ